MDFDSIAELTIMVSTALSTLAHFTQLEYLTWEFSPDFARYSEYPEQEPSLDLILQRHILKNVADNRPPPSLLSLALLNITPMPDAVYASDSFQRLMGIPEPQGTRHFYCL